MLTPLKGNRSSALRPVKHHLNGQMLKTNIEVKERVISLVTDMSLSSLNHAVALNLANDRPTKLNFRSGFQHFTNTCAVWWRLVQKSSRPSQGIWYELSGKH